MRFRDLPGRPVLTRNFAPYAVALRRRQCSERLARVQRAFALAGPLLARLALLPLAALALS
jgi:hypothetical protein